MTVEIGFHDQSPRKYGTGPGSRQSVHLTTLFHTFCAHTFACNLQQPFLNQWKEENDRRNYFMINLQEIMGPGQDRVSQFT